MSDRLFEPTATKMATFSLGKAAAATPRENKKSTRQPPNPPRASMADTGREWNGENPPDRSRDLRILARQPPHRRQSTTSSQRLPSGTTETPADDGPGRVRPEPSRGEEEAPSKASQMPGNPSRQPTNQIWVHRDPPHLIEDEGEPSPPPHITPESTGRDNSRETEQWYTPATGPRSYAPNIGDPSSSTLCNTAVHEEGRSQLPYNVTPSPRERILRSQARKTPPKSSIIAIPNHLEPYPMEGGKAQRRKERTFHEAIHNSVWASNADDGVDTTRSKRGNVITQFTALHRLGMIQESSAERRRLLSTTINHYMYEVILWMTRGSLQSIQ
jgi:hypothetical protein